MSKSRTKVGWLRCRFGIKTLLQLMLVVSVFLGGRLSLRRELDDTRREADALRAALEVTAMRTVVRPLTVPQVDPRVDEAMMIDAIESGVQ